MIYPEIPGLNALLFLALELIYTGHTTHHVRAYSLLTRFCDYADSFLLITDYEHQRRDLLRKHGIDLEDGTIGPFENGRKSKRMDRKDVERIMGAEGEGGVFTWRDKNRKKVRSFVRSFVR